MPPRNSSHDAAGDPEIERIRSLDLDGLGLQWRNAFGKRVPKSLPKALLIKVLIYRLQADRLGDLDANVVHILDGYAAREAKGTEGGGAGRAAASTPTKQTIKPSSVLLRDWGGTTHRVMALEAGFVWEGRSYRSLSGVARAITGTRWNGRRLFGVDRTSVGSAQAHGEAGATKRVNPGDAREVADEGAKPCDKGARP